MSEMTVRNEANLTDVIARSWCDGYRAAKDPNKENVIPDFLADAEGDLGERSTAYTAKAIEYYGYRGDVTLENALDELPREPNPAALAQQAQPLTDDLQDQPPLDADENRYHIQSADAFNAGLQSSGDLRNDLKAWGPIIRAWTHGYFTARKYRERI